MKRSACAPVKFEYLVFENFLVWPKFPFEAPLGLWVARFDYSKQPILGFSWFFLHFIEPIHKYSDLERTFWATFYIFGPYHSSTDWKMTIVHEIMPICLVRANSEPENALKIGLFDSIKGLFRWVEGGNTTWQSPLAMYCAFIASRIT